MLGAAAHEAVLQLALMCGRQQRHSGLGSAERLADELVRGWRAKRTAALRRECVGWRYSFSKVGSHLTTKTRRVFYPACTQNTDVSSCVMTAAAEADDLLMENKSF